MNSCLNGFADPPGCIGCSKASYLFGSINSLWCEYIEDVLRKTSASVFIRPGKVLGQKTFELFFLIFIQGVKSSKRAETIFQVGANI